MKYNFNWRFYYRACFCSCIRVLSRVESYTAEYNQKGLVAQQFINICYLWVLRWFVIDAVHLILQTLRSIWLINQKKEFYKLTNQKIFQSICSGELWETEYHSGKPSDERVWCFSRWNARFARRSASLESIANSVAPVLMCDLLAPGIGWRCSRLVRDMKLLPVARSIQRIFTKESNFFAFHCRIYSVTPGIQIIWRSGKQRGIFLYVIFEAIFLFNEYYLLRIIFLFT